MSSEPCVISTYPHRRHCYNITKTRDGVLGVYRLSQAADYANVSAQ